jgi:hypothetical protein
MDGEEGGTWCLQKQKKNDGGCVNLCRTIHIKVRLNSSVLPELRADVRDQILLVISEPVLSKKILALQMQGTDSHDWGGRWNLVTYL